MASYGMCVCKYSVTKKNVRQNNQVNEQTIQQTKACSRCITASFLQCYSVLTWTHLLVIQSDVCTLYSVRTYTIHICVCMCAYALARLFGCLLICLCLSSNVIGACALQRYCVLARVWQLNNWLSVKLNRFFYRIYCFSSSFFQSVSQQFSTLDDDDDLFWLWAEINSNLCIPLFLSVY